MIELRAEDIKRVVIALERSADANEKLLEIANNEQLILDEGPVVCPHCGAQDPIVTPREEGGSGPLSEFVVIADTNCCARVIYAVPSSYVVFDKQKTVEAYMMEGRA
jgi:hypothetical protein